MIIVTTTIMLVVAMQAGVVTTEVEEANVLSLTLPTTVAAHS